MDVDVKDMTVPTLTFGAETKEMPAVVEETAVAEAQEPAWDDSLLSDEERQMVDNFVGQIDLDNSNAILQYGAVSYTHLDVYKRQVQEEAPEAQPEQAVETEEAVPADTEATGEETVSEEETEGQTEDLNSNELAEAESVADPVETDSEYANIAIAQVSNYVNVRDIPSEEGEVLGKLYNNSAATVEGEEDGWYKITSGSVSGYVKCEYVVTGAEGEALAKQVGRKVAVVTTTTLKVRKEPSTEAPVLGLVPIEDELTVTDETDGWVKVSIEEGDGWVSTDFVSCHLEFVEAESKAEEEARLAREAAERESASKAASKSRCV